MILLSAQCLISDAQAAEFASHKSAISVYHETVGDSVNYTPNLPEGGFADPQRRSRFQSIGLDLAYRANLRTKYNFSIQRRQINSLRDSFVVNEFQAGIEKRLKTPLMSRFSLDVGVGFTANQSSEIYKNSYTSYADRLITEVRLREPQDARLSAKAILGIELTGNTKFHIGISGGVTRTQQKNITGAARLDNNCEYNFSASNNSGSLTQVGRCGSTLLFKQFYPTDESVNTNLGFSVNSDLSYRDYFIGPSLRVEWNKGNLRLSAGYEFRQYFRPNIDDRIREAGGSPITSNQNAFTNAQLMFWQNWQLDVRAAYQSAAFLDDIPFLYTTLTYQRFSDASVIRYALQLTRFF